MLSWVPAVLSPSGLELPAPPAEGDDAALAPTWDAFAGALQAALDGPKVDVATGASTQDRLIAFTGRDPAWRPAATP